MSRWSLKWHLDPYCRTCFHGDAHIGACLYILNTEKRRPCPAGAGCTKRITEKEWNEMQKSMNLDGFAPVKVGRSARTKWTPEMVDELRRLRAQGLTATQIADRMGLDAEKIEKKCYSLGIKRGAAAVTGGSNTPAQDEDCRVADAPRNDNEETAGGESSDSSREPDTEKRKEQHDLEHMTIGKLVALCGEDRETEIFVNGQPVRIVQYMERYDLEARCGAALVDLISADKNRQP